MAIKQRVYLKATASALTQSTTAGIWRMLLLQYFHCIATWRPFLCGYWPTCGEQAVVITSFNSICWHFQTPVEILYILPGIFNYTLLSTLFVLLHLHRRNLDFYSRIEQNMLYLFLSRRSCRRLAVSSTSCTATTPPLPLADSSVDDVATANPRHSDAEFSCWTTLTQHYVCQTTAANIMPVCIREHSIQCPVQGWLCLCSRDLGRP